MPDASAQDTPITTPEQRRRAFRLLFVCLVCVGMGHTIMFSLLPPLARELGMTETQTGYIHMSAAIVWVLLSPWWGRRSDLWGRRPVILIGLLGFSLSSVMFAFAVDWAMAGWVSVPAALGLMIFSRLVYGILGCGVMPAAQAYVADRTTPEERTAGLAGLGAAFGLGSTLGPAVGGALVVLSLVAPFHGLALLSLASALAIWFLLPERTLPRQQQSGGKLHPWDGRVVWHLAVGLLMGTVQSIIFLTVAFLFMDVLVLNARDAAQMVGVGMMASSMAALFAQIVIAQKLSLPPSTLLWLGAVINAASFGLFLVAESYGPLVFALVLSGLGIGIARPGNIAAASLSVGPAEQGRVAGLMNATIAAGWIITPVVALPLYRQGAHIPYALGLGLSLVLIAIVVLHPAMRRAGPGTSPAPLPETTDPSFPGT
ncbi:MFS transporter [Zavarzinia sp. CC-PAN008]|uniref:MFS transporter n=1 Tax=Zavarzinia sp. CC-PAN008 TaxID=3243332 RepID=UPI003F748E6C